MTYHQTVGRLLDLLQQHGAWHETFEHEPVRTSEAAAQTRPGYGLHQGAKALIVNAKMPEGTKLVMLVFPADRRFDSKKAKRCLNAKSLSFATEEEVGQVTGGVQVGGVPPFGNLFGLDVVVDPSLFRNEKIVFNAGDRSFSVGMKSQDYRSIVKPKEADIIQDVSGDVASVSGS